MTFVRNPRYWGSHTAYLDRIVMRNCRSCGLLPPAEVLASIKRGDVDIAGTRDPVFISELRAHSGSEGHRRSRKRPGSPRPPPRPRRASRAQEQARPPCAGLRHRPEGDRAHGLRRARPELSGERQRRVLQYQPPLPPQLGDLPLSAGSCPRLLEQAGCRRGADEIYVCAGERLSLRFIGLAGATFRVRTLDMVQRQLRQVGVAIELSYAPAATLFGPIFDSGAFDAVEFAVALVLRARVRASMAADGRTTSPGTASGSSRPT